MPTTDTSEKGLESLIVAAMTGGTTARPAQPSVVREASALYGGTGWLLGRWQDYDREYALDLAQLAAFLRATQPETAAALELDEASPTRHKFLARLRGEITKRGVIDVLRHGVKHGQHQLDLFLTKQTVGDAEEQYKRDRDPRELLFQFALDDQEVRFCTHLQDKQSWFLPFNRGRDDGTDVRTAAANLPDEADEPAVLDDADTLIVDEETMHPDGVEI